MKQEWKKNEGKERDRERERDLRQYVDKQRFLYTREEELFLFFEESVGRIVLPITAQETFPAGTLEQHDIAQYKYTRSRILL